jgi:hypothetical protein
MLGCYGEKFDIFKTGTNTILIRNKIKFSLRILFDFELTARRICLAFRFDIISNAVKDCSAISMDVILRN